MKFSNKREENNFVIRCYDPFDNETLGYRFAKDELTANKFARHYDDADHCGNGYAVYPRACRLSFEVEMPEGSEYPYEGYEETGAFSKMARRFDEVIKDPAVTHAALVPWFDETKDFEKKYWYVRIDETLRDMFIA